jgi:hypothetical protein
MGGEQGAPVSSCVVQGAVASHRRVPRLVPLHDDLDQELAAPLGYAAGIGGRRVAIADSQVETTMDDLDCFPSWPVSRTLRFRLPQPRCCAKIHLCR